MSVVYSVTIVLQAEIESEWIAWMNEVHIPDVLRTGCFEQCRVYKVLDAEKEEPTYVMQYHCRSREEYQRYRENFAPALQKDHSNRFAGRFRGSRQLLEQIGQLVP
jgi:hypothetical protein